MKIAIKVVIVSLSQFATSMERIVVFMILSRTLSQSDYGTYQQVWLFYLTILPLFVMGLPSSLLYFIPKSTLIQRKTVVFQTLVLLEIVGLIFCAITFFTAPLMASQFNNPTLVSYLRIFAFYPLFSLSPKILNLLMIANDKPINSAISSVIYSIISIIFIITPSIIGLPLVYTFYGAISGAAIFFFGFLLYLGRYYRNQKIIWDWKLLLSQVVYSIPLGLGSILGTLSTQINRFVVSSSFSTELFAIFTNGAFEIPFIGMITGSLMTVLIPEFVSRLEKKESTQSVWQLWNDSTLKTALLLFPITIYFLVFSSDIMIVLFSTKYVESTSIFRIYLLVTFVRITQYGSLLQAMGKTKLILIISIIGLILNLLFSMVSIPLLGLHGPAWANVATVYMWAIMYLFIIHNLLKIPISMIMPWKRLFKLLIVAILTGFIVYPILLLELNPILRLSFGAFLYFVIYFILQLAFKNIDTMNLLSALQQIKRKVNIEK
jgi:O-antigen/teichoic acid export membrane protein